MIQNHQLSTQCPVSRTVQSGGSYLNAGYLIRIELVVYALLLHLPILCGILQPKLGSLCPSSKEEMWHGASH